MSDFFPTETESAAAEARRFLRRNPKFTNRAEIPNELLSDDYQANNHPDTATVRGVNILRIFVERIEQLGVDKFKRMDTNEKANVLFSAVSEEHILTPHDSGKLEGTLARLRKQAECAEFRASQRL